MDTRLKGQKIRQFSTTKIKAVNAKVQVQYVRNHQLVGDKTTGPAATQNDVQKYDEVDESENVEYLDETICDEQATKTATVEAAIKTDTSGKQSAKPFKDTFYANAVHCLVALYKNKYLEMKGKTEQQIRALRIWDHITKEMHESYFDFSRTEIKQKFSQMRRQYFSVASAEEIEDFEYFDQLHDIYQDKYIDAIAAGALPSHKTEQRSCSNTYQDEDLQLEEEQLVPEGEDAIEILEEQLEEPQTEVVVSLPAQHLTDEHEHNYQSTAQEVIVETDNEIAHKENEFIDMVEKELQAIVEGHSETPAASEVVHEAASDLQQQQEQQLEDTEMLLHQQEMIVEHEEIADYTTTEPQLQSPVQTIIIKREQEDDVTPMPPAKRRHIEENVVMPCVEVPAIAQQTLEHREEPTVVLNAVSSSKEFTLADYNQQQERRHQEKMTLMRQSLLLQERAIETHRQLMESLIKRL